MKSLRPHMAASPLLIIIAAAVFAHAAVPSARAQGRAPRSPGGSGRDLSSAERDVLVRESETKRTETKRDPDAVMAEVNEDFERLRALHDDLRKAAEAASAPDHKSVALTAVEVRKRAVRLEKNLSGLPRPEKGEKPTKASTPADDAQMKASLITLTDTIKSFLSNPVFSDVGTLDPQLAVRARRDLEAVLAQSEAVRKGAEKLSKR